MSPARLATLAVLAMLAITGAFWLSTQRHRPRDTEIG